VVIQFGPLHAGNFQQGLAQLRDIVSASINVRGALFIRNFRFFLFFFWIIQLKIGFFHRFS
jgi:hypothetical protein